MIDTIEMQESPQDITEPRLISEQGMAARERHADNDNRLPANAVHANGNEGE